jgi:hypothetical protein
MRPAKHSPGVHFRFHARVVLTDCVQRNLVPPRGGFNQCVQKVANVIEARLQRNRHVLYNLLTNGLDRGI